MKIVEVTSPLVQFVALSAQQRNTPIVWDGQYYKVVDIEEISADQVCLRLILTPTAVPVPSIDDVHLFARLLDQAIKDIGATDPRSEP